MLKTTVVASLLAVILLLPFVQYPGAATAGAFDWSALPVEGGVFLADENEGAPDKSATTQKKSGNGFMRALGAPFRAFGRLFGGEKNGKNKEHQTTRRITDKET